MLLLATSGHLWELRDIEFPIGQFYAQWSRIGNEGTAFTAEPVKGKQRGGRRALSGQQ